MISDFTGILLTLISRMALLITFVINNNGMRTELKRKLHIDFEMYTDENESFNRELTGLILENLKSLKKELFNTVETNSAKTFLDQYHKVFPSIIMLNDAELLNISATLREHFSGGKTLDEFSLQRNLKSFSEVCDSLIMSLRFVAMAA